MFVIYQTANGALVSIGSVVANPLPAGLTAVELTPEDALALRTGLGTWDPATLTVVPTPLDTRVTNEATLSGLDVLLVKMAELKGFLVDPDIDAVEAQTNNQPMQTAALNRALKAMVRQLRRDANFDIRLARYVFGQVHPELFDDISDT